MCLKALAPPTGVTEISTDVSQTNTFSAKVCMSFCCLQVIGPDPYMQEVYNIYCYYYLTIIQHQQNTVQSIVQYKTYA